MTLTRWRSTILSATRARPPRLGGSSRNAASSSSFLSFTRRFLSSEVTTTFGRARIHREAIGFFLWIVCTFFGGRRAPHVFSPFCVSFPKREKVKNLLEKGEGEDATSSGLLFFFARVSSHRNFASSKKKNKNKRKEEARSLLCVFSKNLSFFSFFLGETGRRPIFFFFFFLWSQDDDDDDDEDLVTAFSETTTTRRRDERMRMMMMIKGKNPTLLFISHAHA